MSRYSTARFFHWMRWRPRAGADPGEFHAVDPSTLRSKVKLTLCWKQIGREGLQRWLPYSSNPLPRNGVCRQCFETAVDLVAAHRQGGDELDFRR